MFTRPTRVPASIDISTHRSSALDEEQMRAYCDGVPGPKMANMVEQGDTPVLSASALQEMGYKIAIYPASLMLAGIQAMEASLAALAAGQPTTEAATFMHLQDLVGFPDYYEAEKRYAAD